MVGWRLVLAGFVGFWTKKLAGSLLDGQFDPLVHERAEEFVDGESLFELRNALGPNEPADLLAAIDIGEFAIRAVTLRV